MEHFTRPRPRFISKGEFPEVGQVCMIRRISSQCIFGNAIVDNDVKFYDIGIFKRGISIAEREAMEDCVRKKTWHLFDSFDDDVDKPFGWNLICGVGDTTGRNIDVWYPWDELHIDGDYENLCRNVTK